MSALESSPVHWLKSRPSGKRRMPGNAGTAASLAGHVVSLSRDRKTSAIFTDGLYLQLSLQLEQVHVEASGTH
jgi:hypothetical protein